MPKPLIVWITIICVKFFKRWEYQTTFPAFWETCMQVKKQQFWTVHETTDWFQIGKEVCQGCILSPCLHICRVKCWAGWSTSWNQDSGWNINNLKSAEDATLIAESKEELKNLLMKGKEGSEKAGLKLYIQKTKIMASGPITLFSPSGNSDRPYFWGLQNHCKWWLQP